MPWDEIDQEWLDYNRMRDARRRPNLITCTVCHGRYAPSQIDGVCKPCAEDGWR